MKNTYILAHIKKYGNCYIPESMYKRLGRNRILTYLKNNGFICEIKKHKDIILDLVGNIKEEETDIIIWRVK